ncbi:hypothetical protein [Nostoc sp.]|uniref:hypothetical protein n=1 Tax=Nostoc sp. TaxID=1180 RepID=UPI002FF57D77
MVISQESLVKSHWSGTLFLLPWLLTLNGAIGAASRREESRSMFPYSPTPDSVFLREKYRCDHYPKFGKVVNKPKQF